MKTMLKTENEENETVDECMVPDAFDLDDVYGIDEHEKFTKYGSEGAIK